MNTKFKTHWYSSLISDAEIKEVSQAVAQAESKTSGEIVPIIVRRSSVIGQVQTNVALLVLLFLFSGIKFDKIVYDYFSWHDAWWANYAYYLILFIILIFSFLIGKLLSQIPWVQRNMIPKADLADQVDKRALVEFELADVKKTKAGTGVLIFISLMERRAVVLAGKGIADKLPKETWDKIIKLLIEKIHQGKTAQGLILAINQAGDLLSQHFPKQHNDENELPNHLILKE